MKENERDSLIYYKEMGDLLIKIWNDHEGNPNPEKDYIIESQDNWEHHHRSTYLIQIARSFNLLARWFPLRNEAILKNGALIKFKRKKEAK
jgi:hypothetical protein